MVLFETTFCVEGFVTKVLSRPGFDPVLTPRPRTNALPTELSRKMNVLCGFMQLNHAHEFIQYLPSKCAHLF